MGDPNKAAIPIKKKIPLQYILPDGAMFVAFDDGALVPVVQVPCVFHPGSTIHAFFRNFQK